MPTLEARNSLLVPPLAVLVMECAYTLHGSFTSSNSTIQSKFNTVFAALTDSYLDVKQPAEPRF